MKGLAAVWVPQALVRQEGRADQMEVGEGVAEQREDQVFRAEEKQEDLKGGGMLVCCFCLKIGKMNIL